MKKYIPYLLLAIVIVIFVAREMFTSSFTRKQELQIQSWQNRSNYLYKQLHESKDREENWIDMAANAKNDVARLESFVKYYKLKSIEDEKKDRVIVRNYTPNELDSIFAVRYPQPDSVRICNPTPGVN